MFSQVFTGSGMSYYQELDSVLPFNTDGSWLSDDAATDSSLESEEVDWLSCISAIEFDQGHEYFCDARYSETRNDLKVIRGFGEKFSPGFYYSLTAYNPWNKICNPVWNQNANVKLMADLRNLLPGCLIRGNFSYFPKRVHHFERGFTVVLPLTYHVKNHEEVIHNLAQKYQQAAYFKCVVNKTGISQTLVLFEGPVPTRITENLVCIEKINFHPAYLHQRNNSLFHQLRDIVNVLRQSEESDEVDELISIARRHLSQRHQTEVEGSANAFPVLSVEGIHMPGGRNHGKSISKLVGAAYLKSPPACVKHLKHVFDAKSPLLKWAYYSLSNYIVASELEALSREKPVIVNGYWYNTAAMTIAEDVGKGVSNLPPVNHDVYRWPDDLLRPTAVVLVASKAHLKSLKKEFGKTAYESKKLMMEVFKRMRTSSFVELKNSNDSCKAAAMFAVDRLKGMRVLDSNVLAVNEACPAYQDSHVVKSELSVLQRHYTAVDLGATPNEEDKYCDRLSAAIHSPAKVRFF